MTAHNEAKQGDIAKYVIMPGDPMRAKYIAEQYLEKYRLVNQLRGMYAYTGTYKGCEVTVMGSGMGMPSIGIYSNELYEQYGVEGIIRIGSCGAYQENLNLLDVILTTNSYSESNFAKVQNGCTDSVLKPDEALNKQIQKTAHRLNISLKEGTIHSSDVFYLENDAYKELALKQNCLATEMESFALFHNANRFHKKAACILTVSNHLVTGAETTGEERQTSFRQMILLALETVASIHE